MPNAVKLLYFNIILPVSVSFHSTVGSQMPHNRLESCQNAIQCLVVTKTITFRYSIFVNELFLLFHRIPPCTHETFQTVVSLFGLGPPKFCSTSLPVFPVLKDCDTCIIYITTSVAYPFTFLIPCDENDSVAARYVGKTKQKPYQCPRTGPPWRPSCYLR